jgi:HPt (histidine-containing phosphotransfer) domain-containing protein
MSGVGIPPAADGAERLDVAAALARLGGNAALLGELAAIFLEEYPQRMAEIAESLGRDDAPGLHHAAHQLRGSLLCLGAAAAGEPARELEAGARAGDLAAATHAYADLETALHRLTPALSRLARAALPDAPHEETP